MIEKSSSFWFPFFLQQKVNLRKEKEKKIQFKEETADDNRKSKESRHLGESESKLEKKIYERTCRTIFEYARKRGQTSAKLPTYLA